MERETKVGGGFRGIGIRRSLQCLLLFFVSALPELDPWGEGSNVNARPRAAQVTLELKAKRTRSFPRAFWQGR